MHAFTHRLLRRHPARLTPMIAAEAQQSCFMDIPGSLTGMTRAA
jgi:hypothetical protein